MRNARGIALMAILFLLSASVYGAAKANNVYCPVTGEKIHSKEIPTVEYKGKKYNLCCEGCVEEFNKNPAKFVSRIKEINVTAKRFRFTPSQITVRKGDIVILTLRSEDASHGLRISEYGIDLKVNGGEKKTAQFIANKAGKFIFACSVYCGQGHSGMKGELIVK